LKPRCRTRSRSPTPALLLSKGRSRPTAKGQDWLWTPKIGGDKGSSRGFWASRSGWPLSPSHSRSHNTGHCADSLSLRAAFYMGGIGGPTSAPSPAARCCGGRLPSPYALPRFTLFGPLCFHRRRAARRIPGIAVSVFTKSSNQRVRLALSHPCNAGENQ
jgi:hypothetical protein